MLRKRIATKRHTCTKSFERDTKSENTLPTRVYGTIHTARPGILKTRTSEVFILESWPNTNTILKNKVDTVILTLMLCIQDIGNKYIGEVDCL